MVIGSSKGTADVLAYNSLTDRLLTDYFSGRAIRRHLQNIGLVTKEGYVVSEKEFQRQVASDVRQERDARMDRERKAKELSWQREKQRKLKEQEKIAEAQRQRCRLPNWKNQVHPQELSTSSTKNPVLKSPLVSTPFWHSLPNLSTDHPSDAHIPIPLDSPDNMRPVRNCPHKPHPNKRPKRKKVADRQRCLFGSILGLSSRQLRRTLNRLCPSPPPSPHRLPKETKCNVTLHFLGRRDGLGENAGHPHWVQVEQQPRDGVILTVFQEYLRVGESLTFASRRCLDQPFSLTLWLDRLRHARVNACCESKRVGSRLGGPGGQFVLLAAEGSQPCFQCRSSEDHVVAKHRRRLAKIKQEEKKRKSAENKQPEKEACEHNTTVKQEKLQKSETENITVTLENKEGSESEASEIETENEAPSIEEEAHAH